jgi:hypothetical protein
MKEIDSTIKFLHCIPKQEYLMSALSDGLMLTDHEVKFSVTEDRDQLEALLKEVQPLIDFKLASLGLELKSLPKERVQILFSGIGTMRGVIPMICLTEVPQSRNISQHRLIFGSFGIVPRNIWVANNNAERIIYAGHNSPASKILFKCLATMHILGLHLDQNGQLLFNTMTYKTALPLLSYFESRENLSEAEWRIAGTTGYLGEKRNTGSKIPLPLEDIEYIFAPSAAIINDIQALVDDLAIIQECGVKPIVMAFPDVMPV